MPGYHAAAAVDEEEIELTNVRTNTGLSSRWLPRIGRDTASTNTVRQPGKSVFREALDAVQPDSTHRYEDVRSTVPQHHDRPIWRPVMLRTSSLLLLALTSLVLLALLEVINAVISQQQGIDVTERSKVASIKYLPTIAVVVLGFVWRSLLSDLKCMTPWSAMTDRTVPASESIAVNYLNAGDFWSFFKAGKRGHWSLVVGLAGMLLSGLLVSFTNALTYVNDSAVVTLTVPMQRMSEFVWQNQFTLSNGTLVPYSVVYSGHPYAAVRAALQPNGIFPPWTTDGMAFDAFEGAEAATSRTANSTAFKGELDCTSVRTTLNITGPASGLYTQNETQYWAIIEPNDEDTTAAGCRNASRAYLNALPGSALVDAGSIYEQQSSWHLLRSNGEAAPAAWFNLTTCHDNSTQIWAHLLMPVSTDIKNSQYNLRSMLCKPRYYSGTTSLTVDGFGRVLAYDVSIDSHLVDDPISPAVLLTYLNNPFDGAALDAFRYDWLEDLTTRAPDSKPIVNDQNVTNWADFYYTYRGQDPFFALLMNDGFGYENAKSTFLTDNMFSDNDTFSGAVESRSSNYIAQFASYIARRGAQGSLTGQATVVMPRLYIRTWSLRAAQSTLAVLAVFCILLATVLRIRSCLHEDGSTMAAAAVLLANNPHLEQHIIDKPCQDILLRASVQGIVITTTPSKLEDKKTLFVPKSLHWSYITAVASVVIIMIAVLSVTLQTATHAMTFPLDFDQRLAQDAWVFIPTLILVFLGYSLSSMCDSLLLLEPYRLLMKPSADKHGLTFNPINHSIFSLPSRRYTSASLILICVSLLTISFPAAKIAAAGLYFAVDANQTYHEVVGADTFFHSQFESTYNLSALDAAHITERASQWNTWTDITLWDMPSRINALDDLVFSAISVLGTSQSKPTSLSTNLPAIRAHVDCEAFDTEDFELWVAFTRGNVSGIGIQPDFRFLPKNHRFSVGATNTARYVTEIFKQQQMDLPNYIATTYMPTDQYENFLPGSNFTLTIADFSHWLRNGPNLTEIMEPVFSNGSLETSFTLVDPKLGNLPSVRGVVCSQRFEKVNVDVNVSLFRQGVAVNGVPEYFPPFVESYDGTSIQLTGTYNTSIPHWTWPYHVYPTTSFTANMTDTNYTSTSGYFLSDALAGGDDSQVVGSSLYPVRGATRNIWEQLAVYRASFNNGSLLDVDTLVSSAEAVLTSYAVNMLVELRDGEYIANLTVTNSSNVVSMRQAAIQGLTPAIRQSRSITYVVQSLLATVFILAIAATLIYIPLPGRTSAIPRLPMAPGSILAATSLLAGSELVKRLRDSKVKSVQQMNLEGHEFRLGYWKTGDDDDKQRWGIDIIT